MLGRRQLTFSLLSDETNTYILTTRSVPLSLFGNVSSSRVESRLSAACEPSSWCREAEMCPLRAQGAPSHISHSRPRPHRALERRGLLIGQNLHLIRLNTPSARSHVTPCLLCRRSLYSNTEKLEMQENLTICRHLTDLHHGAIIRTKCNIWPVYAWPWMWRVWTAECQGGIRWWCPDTPVSRWGKHNASYLSSDCQHWHWDHTKVRAAVMHSDQIITC